MNKDLLSGRHFASIIGMIIISEILFSAGYVMAETGDWLAMVAAIILGNLIYLVYAFILRKYPNESIYDVFLKIFGKVIGRVFIIIFIIYAVFVAALTLGNGITTIIRLDFMNTPDYVVGFILSVYVFLFIRKGVEIFGRIIAIIFPIIIAFIIIYLILLVPKMNFIELTPLVASPLSEMVKGTFFNFFIITGDIALVLCLKVNTKNDKNVHFKAFFGGSIIAGLLFVLIMMANVAALGLPLASMIAFPTYQAFSLINIADFITRIEIIFSLFLHSAATVKYAIALVAISKGFGAIFKKSNYYALLFPASMFCFFVSMNFIGNITTLTDIRENYGWLKAFPQVIIPIIVAIASLFIKDKSKPKGSLLNIFNPR